MHSLHNLKAFTVASLLLCGAYSSAQNAVPRYKLTDLGALSGYPNSRAYGINNKGQVVGQVAKLQPKLEAHAVLWDNGKVQDIAVPEGLAYGVATAINDQGQIVGGSEIQNYGSHGFHIMGLADKAYLWQNSKMSALAADGSHAYAINNAGQIVGTSKRTATLWKNGKPTKLNELPDFFGSSAQAISNNGQIAGVFFTKEGKRQAVAWIGEKMQPLGTLPGDDQSIATAVNDAGVVVGSSGKDNSYSNLPFVWEKGKMEMLFPLDGRTSLNEASGINNHDQIVGYGLQEGIYMHAVLWEKRHPEDLNDLIAPDSGLVLMKATAINDQGQIVGEARDSKTQIHAFLLTPTDVPPTNQPATTLPLR